MTTSKQVRNYIPNPTGKGGFQERPQDRSDGRWSKENSFSYWMNKFKSLGKEEFLAWERTTPPEQQTMAASLAYARVFKARSELKEFQEVANRTEGMPKTSVEVSGPDGTPVPLGYVYLSDLKKSKETLTLETKGESNNEQSDERYSDAEQPALPDTGSQGDSGQTGTAESGVG